MTFQLHMDSTGSRPEILNRFDPFVPIEISQARMVSHKSKVEYVWQVFPYLLTMFVIFVGFFASAKLGSKYWNQRDDIKIFGLPLGRRVSQTLAIPWTFFKTLQHIGDVSESKSYQRGIAEEKPAGGIRGIYEKLKLICHKWISRRAKSEDSYTIVNLLGIVEVRRKNAGEKVEPKNRKPQPKWKNSCTPLTNMASVLKRWDDILKLLFSV